MRQRFNAGRYWERVQSGELTTRVIQVSTPKADAEQPPGTLSQMISYFQDDQEVARVHQYLRPDGAHV